MQMRLELVYLPVSDVDRAKRFYAEQVGFAVDHDHRVSESVRFVQLTPPGAASTRPSPIATEHAAPGSSPGLQVVVDDAARARAQLVAAGVECSEVDEQPWGRFVRFTDPDGNPWSLQELPAGP
jgi:catechol 2,3-dioxygenase-like lactoylglutathione lyase family enzyme